PEFEACCLDLPLILFSDLAHDLTDVGGAALDVQLLHSLAGVRHQVIDQGERRLNGCRDSFHTRLLLRSEVTLDAGLQELCVPQRSAERVLEIVTESTYQSRLDIHDALEVTLL